MTNKYYIRACEKCTRRNHARQWVFLKFWYVIFWFLFTGSMCFLLGSVRDLIGVQYDYELTLWNEHGTPLIQPIREDYN
jgi:hypothetical protein